jgi:predicted dehydrogenase
MQDTFVVVGLGSMGKRRVRDLTTLGAGRIIGVDRREDRRQEVEERFKVQTLDDFDAGLKLQPRAVIVSVPPHLHYKFCRAALESGAAYFVECLTALTMQEIEDLTVRESVEPNRAFPSCTNLMNEHAQHSARALQRLGKVYSIHASISTWLPNQHPWEKQMGDHYEFHRAQGGGLAEPAYQLSWICNVLRQKPVRVTALTSHVSDLPPGFNDLLDMIIELDGGTLVNFHYALCEKHDWTVGIFTRFSGSGGTVLTEQRRSRFYDAVKAEWEEHTTSPNWKYEDVYLLEMRHFLAALNGKETFQGNLQIERGVLATLLAAEESSRIGRIVEIEEMFRT